MKLYFEKGKQEGRKRNSSGKKPEAYKINPHPVLSVSNRWRSSLSPCGDFFCFRNWLKSIFAALRKNLFTKYFQFRDHRFCFYTKPIFQKRTIRWLEYNTFSTQFKVFFYFFSFFFWFYSPLPRKEPALFGNSTFFSTPCRRIQTDIFCKYIDILTICKKHFPVLN